MPYTPSGFAQNQKISCVLFLLSLYYFTMKKIYVIAACLSATFCFAQPGHDYVVVKTFHIASAGGWDYIAVHDKKLYVSHGTQVNILDENSGDSLSFIPNTTGVHGIAFNEALNKGYSSNGRLNNVTVFDLATNGIKGQIVTGENPDAILYEPFSKTIITCNRKQQSPMKKEGCL